MFQNELGGHEVKVDPQLWQGIQSQLGNVASTGAAGSATVAGKVSLLVKIGVAAVITTAAIVTTYVVVNSEKTAPSEQLGTKNDSVQPEVIQNIEPEASNFTQNNLVSEGNSSENAEYIENTPNESVDNESVEVKVNNDAPVLTVPTVDQSVNNVSDPVVTNDGVSGVPNLPPPPSGEPTSVPLELVVSIEKQSNQHYIFSATSEDAEKITWDFGDRYSGSGHTVEHIFSESGTFNVTALAQRGDQEVKEMVSIKVDVSGDITHLPTVFTPNSDGSNDEFFIESKGLLDFSIVIMNDKGGVLFESNTPDFRWDGRDRITGLVADAGIYFYIITAKDELGNTISKHQRLELKK